MCKIPIAANKKEVANKCKVNRFPFFLLLDNPAINKTSSGLTLGDLCKYLLRE